MLNVAFFIACTLSTSSLLCIMRFLSVLSLILGFISLGTASPVWDTIQLSGHVTAFLPGTPSTTDTMGQKIVFYRDQNEMMVCTVAPIPEDVLKSDTFNLDQLLDNFIRDIVSGATISVFSNTIFKNHPAKYCKVRVEDEYHPLFGLILDSYTFELADTVYNLAYWRFNANDLYDYSRQKAFYDKVEISPAASAPTETPEEKIQSISTNVSTQTRTLILALIPLLMIAIWYLYHKYQQQKDY